VSVVQWLSWAALVFALVALFVLWDVIFCGGRRCSQLRDRLHRGDGRRGG